MTPGITVVVASVQGTPSILECLDAIGSPSGADVVVVDRTGDATRDEVARRFPGVRVLAAPAGTPLPTMRGRGLGVAAGPTVAVLGDHMRPGAGWLAALAARPDRANAILGGPVEPGTTTGAAAWAYVLLEYAPFLPPLPAGPAAALPGTNCAYDRGLLGRIGAEAGPVYDAVLHERARGLGVPLVCDPALAVRCDKRLSSGRLLLQRYHCSRVSAARRAEGWPPWRRGAFAAATPLLPPLLLLRLVATLVAKRRYGGAFARALALIVLATVAGACGEAAGALRGAGASAGRAE